MQTALLILVAAAAAPAATLTFADPDEGDYRVVGIEYDDGRRYEIRAEQVVLQEIVVNPNYDLMDESLVDAVNQAHIPWDSATVALPLDGYHFVTNYDFTRIVTHRWSTPALEDSFGRPPYVTYNNHLITYWGPVFDESGQQVPIAYVLSARPLVYSVLPRDVTTETADFDGDGALTLSDIDQLDIAIRSGDYAERFDFWLNGSLETSDRAAWFEYIIPYQAGDANLDGIFGPSDLITVLAAGQFEDATHGNSSWATGDWNGDAEFNASDLIEALATGRYNAPAASVPEPAGWALLLVGLSAAGGRRRWRLARSKSSHGQRP